ncbi:MAG: DUF4337 domain-containing protein [Cellulophaga sp.]
MLEIKETETTILVTVASIRAQGIGGALIVLFSAFMAISEMTNNNLEEEMMIAHNKLGSYSNWYQSKSIKQNLKESELHYLETLILTNKTENNLLPSLRTKIKNTKKLILKYEAEKTEILVGSANVPREYWAQDLDGKMGAIIGVKEWWVITDEYTIATKKFDLAMLFFQISIILGVVSIIIQSYYKLQRTFIILMTLLGLIGTLVSIYGYILAP